MSNEIQYSDRYFDIEHFKGMKDRVRIKPFTFELPPKPLSAYNPEKLAALVGIIWNFHVLRDLEFYGDNQGYKEFLFNISKHYIQSLSSVFCKEEVESIVYFSEYGHKSIKMPINPNERHLYRILGMETIPIMEKKKHFNFNTLEYCVILYTVELGVSYNKLLDHLVMSLVYIDGKEKGWRSPALITAF